jgi:ABC-2 type transport system ATP-binding protein
MVALPEAQGMSVSGQIADGTSPAPTIDVRGLSKWYGSVVAVNEVSLQVFPGITGLLGPNGAGKTTLLHMMAGLAAPSDGEVSLLGEPVRDNPALYRRLGVMSEHETVYDFYTGREFVEFSARLHFGAPSPPAVDRAIEAVGLTEVQSRRLDTYSRGMRQRMRLATTLVHDPDVLLLDEPLSGTDPRQRIEFADLMRRLAADGRTILISSHILEEVETLADSILLMVSGKLAASGDYHAIRAKLDERPYSVRIVASDPRSMAASLVKLDAVDSVAVDPDGALVVLSRNVLALQGSVPRLAQEQGIRLLRVEPLDESLESVFGYLVEG